MNRQLTDFYSYHKKRQRIKNNYSATIIIVLLIVIFLLFVFTGFSTSKVEDSTDCYFLVSDVNISNKDAMEKCKEIEKIGGAGVVYDLNKYKNCVIIMGYNTKNEAEIVFNRLNRLYTNMQIICIKNHKIEKLKHLNNDKYELLKFLNLNKIESFEMLSSYEKGSITISKLYEYVINLRAKLHKYEDDIMDTKIKEFIKKLDELLDYFMMNNLKSEFSAIYLKKYIVMLMLYDVKIREIILQI